MRKIAIIAALLLTTGAQAEGYRVNGQGTKSCASWLASRSSESDGITWLLGMWTGLNLFNLEDHHTVGSSTDGMGIYGEVKKVCAETPSMSLANATLSAYLLIEKREFPASK